MRKVVALVLMLAVLLVPTPGYAASADEGAFRRVWERTDGPVAGGRVVRTWYWGPTPLFTGDEDYKQGVEGKRRVQYYDKGRMEIGNPNDPPDDPWYVSSGLLVKELIAGRVQVGDDDFERRSAPPIPIAGDPDANDSAPTYASFRTVASVNLDSRLVPVVSDPIGPIASRNGQAPRYGDLVAETLDRDGKVGKEPELGARYPGTRIVYWDGTLAHNIPQVFWNFLNQTGRVQVNGSDRKDILIDWVYMMGYPVSEPFWVKTKVGGVENDVLVQPFERRVLTYTPSNAAPYQVEMGNTGLHYYRWRYEELARPAAQPSTRPDNINAMIEPQEGPAGTVFRATLRGFESGEDVSLWLTLPDQSVSGAPILAKANADGVAVFNGNSVIRINTRERDPAGIWAITGQGNRSKKQAIGYFTVTQ